MAATSDINSLRRVPRESRTIAVVGLSADRFRPSYFAAEYMQEHGYRIIPANPKYPEISGEKSYPSLAAIPERADLLVDVFRKPADAPAIAEETVAIGGPSPSSKSASRARERPRRSCHRQRHGGADDRPAQHLRGRRRNRRGNALAVARFLESHPKFSWVNYPGLENNRYHDLARKYLAKGADAVLSFDIRGAPRPAGNSSAASSSYRTWPTPATPRLRSSIRRTTHRQLSAAQQVAAGVPPGLIRLSVGPETLDDILWDIDRALAATRRPEHMLRSRRLRSICKQDRSAGIGHSNNGFVRPARPPSQPPSPEKNIMANSSFDHFTSASKSGLDIFHSLAGVALNQFEQLASHQIAAVRSALHEQAADGKRLLDSKEPREALHLQAARAQPLIDRSLAYYRGLYDISAAAHDAFAKLLEQHHGEANKTVTALLDRYTGASANSGFAVDAVKSALSAANSAFENANKAARQVADITEASVNAAGKATARVVESAVPSRRKAA